MSKVALPRIAGILKDRSDKISERPRSRQGRAGQGRGGAGRTRQDARRRQGQGAGAGPGRPSAACRRGRRQAQGARGRPQRQARRRRRADRRHEGQGHGQCRAASPRTPPRRSSNRSPASRPIRRRSPALSSLARLSYEGLRRCISKPNISSPLAFCCFSCVLAYYGVHTKLVGALDARIDGVKKELGRSREAARRSAVAARLVRGQAQGS